jgi:hypothetical protein
VYVSQTESLAQSFSFTNSVIVNESSASGNRIESDSSILFHQGPTTTRSVSFEVAQQLIFRAKGLMFA